jgi:hypothetical protein
VPPAARDVSIAKILAATCQNERGCQVHAQAVPASIFLATDFRTVRRIDMTQFDARIEAASREEPLERTIREGRQHPLPTWARVRELRLLLGKIQTLDRHGLADSTSVCHDVFHAVRDCSHRLMRRRIPKSQRHVEDIGNIPETIGLRDRNEANVEIDADASGCEV